MSKGAGAQAAAEGVMKWIAMRAAARQKREQEMRASQEAAKKAQTDALTRMMNINQIRLV